MLAEVRFTEAGSTSRTCSSMTGSRVFVRTKNRVAIFFPGAISEATWLYSRSCSLESSTDPYPIKKPVLQCLEVRGKSPP